MRADRTLRGVAGRRKPATLRSLILTAMMIEREQLAQLDRLATRERRSRSNLMRLILEQWLAEHGRAAR